MNSIRLTAIFAAVMAMVLAGAGDPALSRFRDSQSEYSIAHKVQQAALDDLVRELATALPTSSRRTAKSRQRP
jgi:hypothetical protein